MIIVNLLKRKNVILTSLISIMFLLIGCGVSEEIETEVDDFCIDIKNELMEEFPIDSKDTQIIEIEDITYSVNKIEKLNDVYSIISEWNISVVDSFLTSKGQKETLYNKIEYGLLSKKFSDGSGVLSVDLTLVVNDSEYKPKNKINSNEDVSKDNEIGEGGYEMPNENDKSITDYIQRVDPDLYNDMENRWENME